MGRHLAALSFLFLAWWGAGVGTSQPPAPAASLLAVGEQLMKAGDYQGAISQFRRALLLDPRNVDAHRDLGWCYLRTSQFRYAVSSFSTALSLAPNLTSARRGLGLAYYRLGEYEACVRSLDPVWREPAGDPEVRLCYGRSLLALGRAREALPHLQAAEPAGRRDASVLMSLAEAHRKLKNHVESEQYYQAVLRLEPTHAAALRGLLSLYQDSGRPSAARQLLRRMLEAAPNDPILIAELAKTDQVLGLHREALDLYERLSQLVQGPQSLALHATLADTYMAAGQAALARPHYQAAVAQQPRDARLRASLANCLRALGRREEAAEQYRQAALLEPKVAAWRFSRAELLAAADRGAEALAEYQAGLELEPGNAGALAAVSELARGLDRPDLARDALVGLLAAQPGALVARLALSDVYRDLGDVKASDAQAWEALRADPRSVEARYRLARSAEELGDLDGAIAHLRALALIDPTQTAYLTPLGRLLAAEGRLPEAIAEYERLLKQDPKNAMLRADLASLYLKTRRLEAAHRLLTDLLAEKPDSVWAVGRLAECEHLLGHRDAALRMWRQVAQVAPRDEEVLKSVLREYEALGRWREGADFVTSLLAAPDPPATAARALVSAYERHAGEAAALEQIRGLAGVFRWRPVLQLVAAEVCAAAGLRAEAIDRYAWYLDRRPDDWDALTVLVALCRDEGRLDLAQRRLLRYVSAHPRETRALLQLARVSLDDALLNDAFAAVSQALATDASEPAAYRLLADILAKQYGPAQAVSVLKSRAEATPDPAPRVGLAYAWVLQGEPGQALSVLAGAVETRRSAADASYVRGLAENALGLHAEAVVELARASATERPEPDYGAALASALGMAGRPEDALWEYARLLEQPAGEARGVHGIRQLLAARVVTPAVATEALRRVGTDHGPTRALVSLLADPLAAEAPAETTAALRDLTDAWPSSEPAWSALADAYQAAGDPAEEARVLARLVDFRPAEVSYHLRLARAYERANAPTRAAASYQFALLLDPANAEASAALKRLLSAKPAPPRPSGPLAPPPSLSGAAGQPISPR